MAKVDPYGCWDGAIDGDDELENMLGSILDFPDFPMEGLDAEGLSGDWDASKSQYLGPIPMDVLMGPPTAAQTNKVETGPPVFMHRPVAVVSSVLSLVDLYFKNWTLLHLLIVCFEILNLLAQVFVHLCYIVLVLFFWF